jgi:Helix-turn-helix domain
VTNPAFSLEDPLLTVDDVAAALGFDQQTVRNYIDDGALPG